MTDDGFITSMMVVIFVLGFLWANWFGTIRDWIGQKVNEG